MMKVIQSEAKDPLLVSPNSRFFVAALLRKTGAT